MTLESSDEMIDFINARDNPLAMYVFTQKTSNRDYIFERTRSGGVSRYGSAFAAPSDALLSPPKFVQNDVLVQFLIRTSISFIPPPCWRCRTG